MRPIQVPVTCVLVLLLLTKVADCYTTLRRIRSADDETNPWARRLMTRWGPRATVLGTGLLAGAISLASAAPCMWDETGWYSAAFVGLGLPIAVIQADVARANWTGRLSAVSRVIARLHAWRRSA